MTEEKRKRDYNYTKEIASGIRPFTLRLRVDEIRSLDIARKLCGLTRTKYLRKLLQQDAKRTASDVDDEEP